LSRVESVENFIKSLKGEFDSEWFGFDGEYFVEGKFYVNNTCLCKVVDDIMYISSSSMTPKCSLYIYELVTRSYELNLKILYIPQWYSLDKRSHEFSESDIINAFKNAVSELKDKRDVYSKARLEDIYDVLKKLEFVKADFLSEVEKILKLMNNALELEESAVKNFIKENSYYNVVQVAYFGAGDYDIKFRTALKKYLNPSGEYAFLKLDLNTKMIYSSECKCGMPKEVMPMEVGYNLGKAYYEKTARHGQKYGNYTVMKVMDNYIQVSCNKYNKDMFNAMYFELIKYCS